ncbi:hypothetical protein [Bacillus sp. S/N-304-OC-R1]|uniref:hypothetical protein n=1 Tax=Bacillus sp. S/N-304-OC-R1 TaxID=2758034 RepID=UPI001C8EA23B|nr:hypothetical protein [Bacillus sp. S/N-304-OC-R1]MBY0122774.1 hypothetical protein [Bacillus sp. S/N-304-OC-R1]
MGTHILVHNHAQHNPLLVVISYIIATISAYAAIELARRMKHTENKTKLIWLFSGASALGVGIWSMQLISMDSVCSHYYDIFYFLLFYYF